ncbi:hypothetical protein ABXJ56_15345 [Microbacterium chocolatum]|uniref:hypothetical protein n=1 Tax=Microbacterium aurantiacum TaxID=162393 RepID=UPI00338FC5E1
MTSSQVRARIVDPRTADQEIDDPVYRVYFVESDGATEEWQLSNVETVEEALSWAREDGRRFDLYAEYPVTATGTGLVRLAKATSKNN